MKMKLATVVAMLALGAGCSTRASDPAPQVQVEGLSTVSVTPTSIVARYHSAKMDLVMTAQVVGDEVRSTIARPDGTVLTEVNVPNGANVQNAAVPARVRTAVDAAVSRFRTLKVTPGQLALMRAVYDDAVERSYLATESIGRGQLRFALNYHTSVLKAVLIEDKSPYYAMTTDTALDCYDCGGTTTTTSTYTPSYGTPCQEYYNDPNIPFHYEEDHPADSTTMSTYDSVNSTTSTTSEVSTATPYLRWLQGSDWGCCGNYAGNCYYAHLACYAHDAICTQCKPSWFCFSGCKPDAR